MADLSNQLDRLGHWFAERRMGSVIDWRAENLSGYGRRGWIYRLDGWVGRRGVDAQMTEDTENLVLEILKKMQGDMASVKEDMHLMRMEMTAIRHDLASVRTLQDVQSTEIERLKGRLDRVEGRLELRDP